MNNFDLMKYGSHAVIGYAGILAYDVLVEGKQLRENFTMADAATFAVSSVVSGLALDVASGVVPFLQDKGLIGMISGPALQGIVYMYLYENMVGKNYPYNRDGLKAFYIGAVGNLLVAYLQNPILGLFGVKFY